MYKSNLAEMTKGWFIGNFKPTLFDTEQVEVAVKKYSAGDKEDAHYHKVAAEFTVIVSGIVKMNGKEYHEGDIIIMEPGDVTDFEAVTDAVNTVVKIPCVKNDKYTVAT